MTDLTNPVFNDADKAREHLEDTSMAARPGLPALRSQRFNFGAWSRTTGKAHEVEGVKHSPHRKGLYFCNGCREQFTVHVGTVLEKSHMPINKWLAGLVHDVLLQEGRLCPPAPPHPEYLIQVRLVHGAPHSRGDAHGGGLMPLRWALAMGQACGDG